MSTVSQIIAIFCFWGFKWKKKKKFYEKHIIFKSEEMGRVDEGRKLEKKQKNKNRTTWEKESKKWEDGFDWERDYLARLSEIMKVIVKQVQMERFKRWIIIRFGLISSSCETLW